MRTIDVLLGGFFGESNRGFLGWSAIYLVTTPSGRRLIFDTGGYNERGTIPKLLEERGLGVTAIDCVVLSHLHFDHAANWTCSPRPISWCTKKKLRMRRLRTIPPFFAITRRHYWQTIACI